MRMIDTEASAEGASTRLYSVAANDPQAALVDRSRMSSEELSQISEIMGALGRLREAELRLTEASQRYMRLGRTDMRALHFLIVAQHGETLVTPGAIARHLGISSASTTKLLDRLETAGHIVRVPHPSDRRARVIRVTDEAREAAMQTVGKVQARRVRAAAKLTSAERAAVIRFLDDMTEQITLKSEAWAGGVGGSEAHRPA